MTRLRIRVGGRKLALTRSNDCNNKQNRNASTCYPAPKMHALCNVSLWTTLVIITAVHLLVLFLVLFSRLLNVGPVALSQGILVVGASLLDILAVGAGHTVAVRVVDREHGRRLIVRVGCLLGVGIGRRVASSRIRVCRRVALVGRGLAVLRIGVRLWGRGRGCCRSGSSRSSGCGGGIVLLVVRVVTTWRVMLVSGRCPQTLKAKASTYRTGS